MYKAYECATYQLRVDEKHEIKTKIRPGKNDLYLLVKNKKDNTPWSKISPTFVNIDSKIKYEVGQLSEEDELIEIKEQEIKRERQKRSKIQQENFKQSNRNYKLPDNMAEIERLMLEEDFNISEDNLTIPINNESNQMITENNEISINKRQLS